MRFNNKFCEPPRQVAISDPLTILKVVNYTDFICYSQVKSTDKRQNLRKQERKHFKTLITTRFRRTKNNILYQLQNDPTGEFPLILRIV